MKRKLIKIDRDKCNGCGNCITGCAEGALALDKENKAVLVNEVFCDGLGACIGDCPTGALTLVEVEAAEFDLEEVKKHLGSSHNSGSNVAKKPGFSQCPSSLAMQFSSNQNNNLNSITAKTNNNISHLRNWPLQLQLISPSAPYLQGANILLAADCTAFAHPNFHGELLHNQVCIITCPKLDEHREDNIEKLSTIFKECNPAAIEIAIMEVPCCKGLLGMTMEAVKRSGNNIPVSHHVVKIKQD